MARPTGRFFFKNIMTCVYFSLLFKTIYDLWHPTHIDVYINIINYFEHCINILKLITNGKWNYNV